MNKKSLYLFLLALILFSILLNTGCTYLWGYHTIVSPDEIRNYDRAMQIALHRVEINKIWFHSGIYELYPAGLHLLISSFILISGDFNVFDISYIFKIMFALIPTLLVFLVGLKIHKWVGLFSAFFYITSFMVFTNSKTHYVYLFTYSNYVATGSITRIMVFASLLSFILFLRNNKGKKYYINVAILYVLFSTAHGVSHISTFLGQLFNLSAFFLFLIAYGYLTNKNHIKNAGSIYLFLTVLSGFFVFLIYYFPMYYTIIGPQYKINHLFPQFLPDTVIHTLPRFFLLSLLSFLIICWMIFRVKSKSILRLTFRNVVYFFLVIYLLLYLWILYTVSENPEKYVYTFVLIFSPFPTYIPHTQLTTVSILSLLAGFSLFALSVIGLYLLGMKKHSISVMFFTLFFVLFVVWFAFGFVFEYYASRIIYFQYSLPFLLGISTYYFLTRKLRNREMTRDGHLHFVKMSLILLLVFLLSSSSLVSVFNKDPTIRDMPELSNSLRFGTTAPPWVTTDFITYVNYISSTSEYIMGNYWSVEALTATTGVKPPEIGFITYYKNHTNWGITVLAIRQPTKHNIERFYDTYYPTKYFVVGYEENFYWGPPMPVKEYDKNPYLLKIYQSNGGQRVYLITF